jgi:hypothetical protein
MARALSAAAASSAMTTEGEVTLDVHDELASMAKLGSLSAAISKDTVSGADLSLVDHVTATIAAADGTLPARLLAQVDVPPSSTEVALAAAMVDSQVLDYLKEGRVVVHFRLTGRIPEHPITLIHSLVARVDIAVASSVTKL